MKFIFDFFAGIFQDSDFIICLFFIYAVAALYVIERIMILISIGIKHFIADVKDYFNKTGYYK